MSLFTQSGPVLSNGRLTSNPQKKHLRKAVYNSVLTDYNVAKTRLLTHRYNSSQAMRDSQACLSCTSDLSVQQITNDLV